MNVTEPVQNAAEDPPMTRTTLLAAMAAGRQRLDRSLATLSDESMLDRVDDTWTRKDVVAHLEAWERRVVANLQTLRAGGAPDGSVETDELNERFYLDSRDRSLDEVRTAEREAYEAALAAVAAASDSELFDGKHFAWTEGDPFGDWFRGNTDEHYDEHLEQLTRPPR